MISLSLSMMATSSFFEKKHEKVSVRDNTEWETKRERDSERAVSFLRQYEPSKLGRMLEEELGEGKTVYLASMGDHDSPRWDDYQEVPYSYKGE
jgi:hypothetical protein